MKLNHSYQIVQNTTVQYIYSVEGGKLVTKLNKLDNDVTFWLIIPDRSFKRRYSIKSCPKWVKDAYEKALSIVPFE